MADLVIGIVRDVLRHVLIEICKRREIRRVPRVRIIVMI
jgi:hypothetical protein